MLISAGFGIGCGIFAGLFILLTNPQQRREYFEDGFYWRNYDGIHLIIRKNYKKERKLSEKVMKRPQSEERLATEEKALP